MFWQTNFLVISVSGEGFNLHTIVKSNFMACKFGRFLARHSCQTVMSTVAFWMMIFALGFMWKLGFRIWKFDSTHRLLWWDRLGLQCSVVIRGGSRVTEMSTQFFLLLICFWLYGCDEHENNWIQLLKWLRFSLVDRSWDFRVWKTAIASFLTLGAWSVACLPHVSWTRLVLHSV